MQNENTDKLLEKFSFRNKTGEIITLFATKPRKQYYDPSYVYTETLIAFRIIALVEDDLFYEVIITLNTVLYIDVHWVSNQ